MFLIILIVDWNKNEMKKEIVWNLSLLLFGIFLALMLALNVDDKVILISGWHTAAIPLFGLLDIIKFGLAIGILLIILRYLIIGVFLMIKKL